MSGRIRSIKPEWLEDEKLLACSCHARLLSVALLLLADDHGRGRAHQGYLGSHVFPQAEDYQKTAESLNELISIGFVRTYSVRGQHYFEVRNWAKHQRVDKPGKPHVPPPEEADLEQMATQQSKSVYFIRGAVTGLIKIGESIDPVARLVELSKCGSEVLQLLAVVANGSRTERELHEKLTASRVHGEWFRPSPEVLSELAAAGGSIESPLATSGYSGQNRVTESFANDSRISRERVATDLDQDQDQDQDQRTGPPCELPKHMVNLERSFQKPDIRAELLFEAFRSETGKSGLRYDHKARELFEGLVDSGVTADEIRTIVQGAKHDEWATGTAKLAASALLKSSEQRQRFAALARDPPRPKGAKAPPQPNDENNRFQHRGIRI